jgi:signal transduction histidine kinase
VEEAVHQSAPLAELRSIKVHIDAKEDSDIHVDSRDAVLLCSNILLNALQHGPDGSNVWMILRTMERIAQLTVRDQGEGVATEDLPHLFDPFYRGDPSRSRKTGGTGLGLSICRAICERAGGLIEICNHPEGGAIVTVQFPVDKPMTESAYSGSLKADAPN